MKTKTKTNRLYTDTETKRGSLYRELKRNIKRVEWSRCVSEYT